jgi:hypothetical protein
MAFYNLLLPSYRVEEEGSKLPVKPLYPSTTMHVAVSQKPIILTPMQNLVITHFFPVKGTNS